MTLENLLSQVGLGTKHLTDRYSEIPVHDHHVYYAYEPSAPSHGASAKHNYGGGHKSGASMSALTLLAFLFFLHILQQCIKDHMTEMSTPPVMIMTAGREGDETITKSDSFNKIDKTGMTETSETYRMKQNKINEKNSEKNPYNNNGSSNKQQLTKIKSADDTKSEDTKNKYVFKSYPNRSSYFAGLYSAMDEE